MAELQQEETAVPMEVITLTPHEVGDLRGILIALSRMLRKDVGAYREMEEAGLDDPERVIERLRIALLM